MSEQSFTLDQFRQARESGVDLYQQDTGAEDAAQQQEVDYDTDAQEEADVQEPSESQETNEDRDVSDDNDADEPIPDEQKNAFYKRVQRERKKAEEEAAARLKAEYESQLNPYKAFFDSLGMTPEQAMQQMESNRLRQEAEQLAYTNGWSEQETQMYMRQQQLEKQQLENSVALQVYELADTPDYPGIKSMKGAITEFIRSNPRANVQQAYWAVGGQNLAQQLKREAEQREIAKRSATPRKVITDSPQSIHAPEPLPAEAQSFMRKTGMSEEQVRMMLKGEGPKNLSEYRQMMKKG